MDPLSIIASVIAVLQLTGVVITYLNDVRDAPKECQQCTIEACNLQSLLISLRYRLEQGQRGDPWFTGVQTLNVENGPLDQYKQALEQLQSKVDVGNSANRIKRRLVWKFSKAEVVEILARMERLKTHVNFVLNNDHFKLSQAIKDDSASIRDNQNLQQHHAIMEWLSPTDFSAQQHDIITRRQEGTGQWFLDSFEFKRWLQGSDKTLFCPGIPGAGKTMMAAIAVDHLCRRARGDDIGVAYLFCSYKAQTDQSASSLFAALLKQLVQSRLDIAAEVVHMYKYHSKQQSRPSLDDILRALKSVCSKYTAVHIVVDALDECADTDSARNQLIDNLRELQDTTDVRLLFTSRFIYEITQKFESNPRLEVRASDEDVRCFVAGQLPRLPRCVQRDEELKQAVQDKIVGAVDGMFLLARLHIDSLLDKRNKQKVLSTLDKLSKGGEKLCDAYSEAIKRIDGQLAEDRSLARRALSWISYAQRLLTTTELCHALAIQPSDTALNNDNIDDVEDVISVCVGLVTVDKESSIIRLVHYTTQEYFERVRLEWNPSAQKEIAVACLTYLSFDTFRSGSCADDKAFEQRLADNAFFDYSAHYWSEHIRPVEEATSHLALAFLCDEALVDCTAQGALTSEHRWQGHSRSFRSQTSGLHLTARYGLLYLTERLLMSKHRDSDIGADSRDSAGWTPLSWAAENGRDAAVRLLLDRGADVNSKSYVGGERTPLTLAVEKGHEAVVRLLLDRGAGINEKQRQWDDDYREWTALTLAVERRHEAVVRLLLDRGADVNAKRRQVQHSYYGFMPGDSSTYEDEWTALTLAVEQGHEAVVRLLLNRGADVNAKRRQVQHSHYGCEPGDSSTNEDEWTALTLAVEKGHEAVVRLLLDHGADVNVNEKRQHFDRSYGIRDHGSFSRHNDEWPALTLAAEKGHEAVVRLLLDRGADVNKKRRLRHEYSSYSGDDDEWTALTLAAEKGHEAVVRLLLDRGADVNEKRRLRREYSSYSGDDDEWTALMLAAEKGHEAVVRLLLNRGADVNEKRRRRREYSSYSGDDDECTALTLAAEKGHGVIVKLLQSSTP